MLSIVIVNYNSLYLVTNCIQSILSCTKDLAFELIVVDNSNENPQILLEKYPSIRWIAMNYNSGFARANNEGIRQSKGEVVLLLNPDIIVKDNAIADCFSRFKESYYVGCGVQLLNEDETSQISGNYVMKGGLNYLLPLPYLGNFLKRIAISFFKISKPHADSEQKIIEVDWINGAFLMVKKSAIEKAGLLDEDFFLYAEEAEWCSRLKKVGRLCIYGQFSVVHLQGETANETFRSSGKGYYNLYDRKGLQIMVSNFVRIRKEFGVGWFLIQLFFYVIEVPILFCGIIMERLVSKNKPGISKAKSFLKNVSFLLKLSPTIIRNKPHFYKVL